MEQIEMLPDFGKHILSNGGAIEEFAITGHVSLNVAVAYVDGLHSVSGKVATNGKTYCVSFDFIDTKVWETFSYLLQQLLFFDFFPFQGKRVESQVVKLDPALPFSWSVIVRPGSLTNSSQTGEEFAPLIVTEIKNISITPNYELLQKRHDWWIRFAKDRIHQLAIPVFMLQPIIKPFLKTSAHKYKLSNFQEFEDQLILILIIYRCSLEDNETDLFKFFCQKNILDSDDYDIFMVLLNDFSGLFKHEGVSEYLKHLSISFTMWFVASLIYEKISPYEFLNTISELLSLQYQEDTNKFIIHDGVFCLARPDYQPHPQDNIEKEIADFYTNDSRLTELVQHKKNKFPKEASDHPELPKLIDSYLKYDVLRQVNKIDYIEISDDVISRCEENIKFVSQIMNMLTGVELDLLATGLNKR